MPLGWQRPAATADIATTAFLVTGETTVVHTVLTQVDLNPKYKKQDCMGFALLQLPRH